MSDSENQGAKWQWLAPPDKAEETLAPWHPEHGYITTDYLNALETQLATLKAQLAAAEGKAARLAQGYLRVLDTMGGKVSVQCRRCNRITRLDEEHLTAEHNEGCIVDTALSAPASDPGRQKPIVIIGHDIISDTGSEEGA